FFCATATKEGSAANVPGRRAFMKKSSRLFRELLSAMFLPGRHRSGFRGLCRKTTSLKCVRDLLFPGQEMRYHCEATSIPGFVQQLAVCYLRHGYYFYVSGCIPAGKDPCDVDRKLIERYGIDLSKWA